MGINFCTAGRLFLDNCRIARTLSPHSLRAYEIDLKHAESKLGAEIAVSSIDRNVLRQYAGGMLRDEHLKETSVKRRMATLKQMFKWLEREDLLPLSPFHRLDLTIRLPRRLPRALTVGDIRKLIETSRHEAEMRATHSAGLMHFVVTTLFVSGLRVGELTGVRLPDLDVPEGTILVRGKGNRERRVYLPGGEARTTLEGYLRGRAGVSVEDDHLLISSNGTAVSPQYIRRRLSAMAKRASISRHVTPHMLRHTAATQLIEAGVDIRFVQKLLGHASIATTQIYTQVSDSALKETLERADALGRLARGRE
ncbi:MAG: tyrosine-type recombinase/integrase [Magnetospirillum sp.]|nr:tyrosine-type recombinase/integrase [Magnetospirillum sp.]